MPATLQQSSTRKDKSNKVYFRWQILWTSIQIFSWLTTIIIKVQSISLFLWQLILFWYEAQVSKKTKQNKEDIIQHSLLYFINL